MRPLQAARSAIANFEGHQIIMNIELPRRQLDLSSAIAEADIRCLLMVLVHMTGDERWLEPPYKPKRDVRLIPDPDAGLPAQIQDEIRAAVVRLFAQDTPKPVITDPGDELILTMMRACLGENVAPEYAPLMREEMGFVPRQARWSQRPADETLAHHHVLIVGAGVCAIALARGPRTARHPLHHCREERRTRRHMVRQPLSRLRRRHAEPFLFLLLRVAKRLDPLFLPARGTARVSEESR